MPSALNLAGLASAARLSAGMTAKPSTEPDLTLELYSFEASPFARPLRPPPSPAPFARPVRELLCSMEIPYIITGPAQHRRPTGITHRKSAGCGRSRRT